MLTILRLAFIITTSCTLKCTHCVHLNSRYVTRTVFDINDLAGDIDRLLGAVDFVQGIHVMGGEALLSPHLTDIVRLLLEQKRIGHVGLTTNGTILPEEPLLTALCHPKAEVYLSNYTGISKTEEWKVHLEKAGVSYHTPEQGKDWIEAGGIEPRGRSVNELRNMFSQCLYRECTTLLNGRLFTCPRNANAVQQNLIPFDQSGSVDLRDLSGRDTRAKIDMMLNATDYLACCDRCDYILPDGSQKHIDRAMQPTP